MSEPLPRPLGNYLLLKALGQGASGDVHLAIPMSSAKGDARPVVIKRLHRELMIEPLLVRRFEQEADLLRFVDNPHVAKVFDVGRVEGVPYIAMEYIEGWSLERLLDALAKMDEKKAPLGAVADIIAGALEGLDALHHATHPKSDAPLSIVHRDICPRNVMIGRDGTVRLIDLGLGKSAHRAWKTQTGVVMGSLGYMPPEQIGGAHEVDARADLYALGIVMYELVTGARYIPKASAPAMLRDMVSPRFVSVSTHRSDLPPAIDDLLRTALAPDREQRFPNARAFLEALRAAVPRSESSRAIDLIDDLLWSELLEAETRVLRLVKDGTVLVARGAADPEEYAPTELVRTPAPMSSMLPNPKRWPAWAAVLPVLLVAALALYLAQGSEEKTAAVLGAEETPKEAAPHAAAHARSQGVEAPEAHAVDPEPSSAEKAAKPSRGPRTVEGHSSRHAAHSEREAEAPPVDGADVNTLIARARSLRSAFAEGSEARVEADHLLDSLAVEAGASGDDHKARVEALSVALERLAKRADKGR